jgi:hypothetical protein
MRFASHGMALGMAVCLQLATEKAGCTWAEQVLPYGLASMWLVTPVGSTLSETSREVRLRGGVRGAQAGGSRPTWCPHGQPQECACHVPSKLRPPITCARWRGLPASPAEWA